MRSPLRANLSPSNTLVILTHIVLILASGLCHLCLEMVLQDHFVSAAYQVTPGCVSAQTLPLHLSLLMDLEIHTAFERPQSDSPNSYLQKDINVCMWCQNKISVCAIKKQLLLAACPNQSQQGARQVALFSSDSGIPFQPPRCVPTINQAFLLACRNGPLVWGQNTRLSCSEAECAVVRTACFPKQHLAAGIHNNAEIRPI